MDEDYTYAELVLLRNLDRVVRAYIAHPEDTPSRIAAQPVTQSAPRLI